MHPSSTWRALARSVAATLVSIAFLPSALAQSGGGTAATLEALHQDLLAVKASINALGAVQPAKPSDLILAIPYLDNCSSGASRVSSRIAPDGSIQPLTIPLGSTFIVTGFSFSGVVAAGGPFRLIMRTETSGTVVAEASTVNAANVASSTTSQVTFASPIRFAGYPCVDLEGASASTRIKVYGFLAKDQ